MFETVRALFRDAPTVVYECRQCGRTVDATTDQCPDCGTAGIARYQVA